MFNNGALDIVIGLVFIYLLYSLLATTIHEIIAAKLSFRAKFLEKAIIRMLDDEIGSLDSSRSKVSSQINAQIFINKLTADIKEKNKFSNSFYNHPLIKYLGEKNDVRKPAYLKSETFSKVVIDLLKGDEIKPGENPSAKIQDSLANGIIRWGKSDEDIQKQIDKNELGKDIQKDTLKFLKSIWVDSQADVERFKEQLERWFNETMDRVSGWYKKYTQFILMLIGLFIAIIFNVDTLEIVSKLEKDPKLREQIVQQADAFVKAHPNLEKELLEEKANNQKQVNDLDSTKTNRDSLLNAKNLQSDNENQLLKKKGDSLISQASNLVQGDIKKTSETLGMGINTYQWDGFPGFLKSIFGWLITALALSLGAPFWFDLLNKLMKLRSSIATGKDDDKQQQKGNQLPKINRVG